MYVCIGDAGDGSWCRAQMSVVMVSERSLRTCSALRNAVGGKDGVDGRQLCTPHLRTPFVYAIHSLCFKRVPPLAMLVHQQNQAESSLRAVFPRRRGMSSERSLMIVSHTWAVDAGGGVLILLQSELGDLYQVRHCEATMRCLQLNR